jgi:hypothetical protein
MVFDSITCLVIQNKNLNTIVVKGVRDWAKDNLYKFESFEETWEACIT